MTSSSIYILDSPIERISLIRSNLKTLDFFPSYKVHYHALEVSISAVRDPDRRFRALARGGLAVEVVEGVAVQEVKRSEVGNERGDRREDRGSEEIMMESKVERRNRRYECCSSK